MSSPVLTRVRPIAHNTATSMPVSDDDDAAGTAPLTPRARLDSPPRELDPLVDTPLPAPAPAGPLAPASVAVPLAADLPVEEPLVERPRVADDPGGLPPEAIAELWPLPPWPLRLTAEEAP